MSDKLTDQQKVMLEKLKASEAKIVINGQELNLAQSMCLRVAVTSFHADLGQPNALGDDEVGQSIAKGSRERCEEILDLILN